MSYIAKLIWFMGCILVLTSDFSAFAKFETESSETLEKAKSLLKKKYGSFYPVIRRDDTPDRVKEKAFYSDILLELERRKKLQVEQRRDGESLKPTAPQGVTRAGQTPQPLTLVPKSKAAIQPANRISCSDDDKYASIEYAHGDGTKEVHKHYRIVSRPEVLQLKQSLEDAEKLLGEKGRSSASRLKEAKKVVQVLFQLRNKFGIQVAKPCFPSIHKMEKDSPDLKRLEDSRVSSRVRKDTVRPGVTRNRPENGRPGTSRQAK